MAVEFSASLSLSTATATRKAIDSLATPQRTPTALTPGDGVNITQSRFSSPSRIGLPGGVEASRNTRASADVSIDRAKQMLGNALTAAHQILDALDTAAGLVNSAAFTSLTDNETNLTSGGTRLSGVTIEAAASRLIDAIDKLVASVDQNGLNLISSSSRPIKVQTTELGGRLTITPQPLDSQGLNLQDLATVDRSDAKEAKGRLDAARQAVISTIQNLEGLQRSLDFGSATSRSFSAISAPGDGVSTRGALVDLQA